MDSQAKRYVIVGAGQAGRRMAESLRQYLPSASITLIGQETHIPYDRPALSKEGLTDETALQDVFINDKDFYDHNSIELMLNCVVETINTANKTVSIANGGKVPYDVLVLATGSRVRTLSLEGLTPEDIFYLRTIEDSRRLRDAAQGGKRVLVIGGGFIGLEVAATLRQHFDAHVTVVEAGTRILQRVMPEAVSEYVRKLHEARGVHIKAGVQIQRAEKSGCGYKVYTSDGVIECDLILAGIGILPNQELAAKAGVAVDNGIVVDEYGRTNIADVYAVGDVTAHYNPFYGKNVRLESWQVAENQPETVARHLAESPDDGYADLPWLWSDQYEFNFQMLGDFSLSSRILVRKEDEQRLTIHGLNDANQLKAVCAINQGRYMRVYRQLMQENCEIRLEELCDPAVPLKTLARGVRSPSTCI